MTWGQIGFMVFLFLLFTLLLPCSEKLVPVITEGLPQYPCQPYCIQGGRDGQEVLQVR